MRWLLRRGRWLNGLCKAELREHGEGQELKNKISSSTSLFISLFQSSLSIGSFMIFFQRRQMEREREQSKVPRESLGFAYFVPSFSQHQVEYMWCV